MASNAVQRARRERGLGGEADAAAREVTHLRASAMVPAVRAELERLAGMFRKRAAQHFRRADELQAGANRSSRRRRARKQLEPSTPEGD